MREVAGDIWRYYDQGGWLVITTNGETRKDGAAVMGRGIALQAAQRFPQLQRELGQHLRATGNRVYELRDYRLYTFPVKHHWRDMADLALIAKSARELRAFVDAGEREIVYSVRPGCGNGQLHWESVKPIVGPYFDDRFVIVEREEP